MPEEVLFAYLLPNTFCTVPASLASVLDICIFEASLYSPSTVILEYLKPGDSLKISDFKSLAIQALHKASEKVRAKYGFACTRTLEEEEKILSWISNYDPDQLISISKE